MLTVPIRGVAKRAMTVLFILCAFSIIAMVAAIPTKGRSADDRQIESVPGEYVIIVKNSSSIEGLRPQLQALGVDVVENIRPDILLLRTKPAIALTKNQEAFLTRLKTLENIVVAEPNYIYRAFRSPNDPNYQNLWGLHNTGAADSAGSKGVVGVDIGAEAAWDIETGSKKTVVAVIDTGIDFSHPDLKGQAWTNETEKNGLPGVDDDGNGLIDDLHGYNFANDRGDSTDDQGHGTHCSGTIGAKGGDGKGIVGVNWDVSLMAVKFLDKSGSGTLANAVRAIDYARKMGARIMSNSWGGGGYSAVLEKAIQDANDAGILFVAAAGNEMNNNDVSPTYPASYEIENILSVAAIDNRGTLASFSNYGVKTVHVAAPGVNVVSSVPGAQYDSYSGTSMAAPHVSGIAALVLSREPALTHIELKKRIIETARPLYTLKNRVLSEGIADAYYALINQRPPPDPNDPARLPNAKPYSFETEHPYKAKTTLEEKIRIPGAKKVAVRFSQFDTEMAYDAVSFYDSTGAIVGILSGKQSPGVTSPLVFGDTIVLKFRSDETVNAQGFTVDSILYE